MRLSLLFFFLINAIVSNAQNTKNEQLIAASQDQAPPLFFEMDNPSVPLLNPNNFKDETEFTARTGFPNFFSKAKKGKALKIAYLGGSITKNPNMYRLQSAKFIQSMFPNITMKGINAGVSGTDADLGACRLAEQVLNYHPDLLFIEFAVNGGFEKGVEGIIRQAKKHDTTLDICLIYTVTADQLKLYKDGTTPIGIEKLDRIAEHYGITSIHLAKEAASLANADKLIEKGDPKKITDKIVFSQDGVHPLPAGGDLYAMAIARTLSKLSKLKTNSVAKLPAPLFADNWEDAKMLSPQEIATFSDAWEKLNPDSIGLGQFKPWFPYLMKAEKPGASFSFTFNGDMFGIFDIGGPEVGQLEVLVDGKSVKISKLSTDRYQLVEGSGDQLNRFNVYCNNRYRGQFINILLPKGIHTISFKISDTIPDKQAILGKNQLNDIKANPQKYNRSAIYLGKILIKGEVVKQ